MSAEGMQLTAWVQLGAVGVLGIVVMFIGRLLFRVADRVVASFDKLEIAIEGLTLATANKEAEHERRHLAVLLAIEKAAKETRHDIRDSLSTISLRHPREGGGDS